jgi:hypothetical protein
MKGEKKKGDRLSGKERNKGTGEGEAEVKREGI